MPYRTLDKFLEVPVPAPPSPIVPALPAQACQVCHLILLLLPVQLQEVRRRRSVPMA